ncbi:MAG: mechanosensitive ion channel [Rhodobacteraceae bacterium]|nr:mechanosensitive ion channel [Paracoccaceae bacterium]
MIRFLAALLTALGLACSVAAQDTDVLPLEGEAPDPAFLSAVTLDGEELFVIRGSSALPANERAAHVEERLLEIAESSDALDVTVEVRRNEFGREIRVDGLIATITTQADAEYEQFELDVLASLQADAIKAAIIAYRDARTEEALVQSAFSALAWSVGFLVISVAFFMRRKFFGKYTQKLSLKRLEKVEEATLSIVRMRAVIALSTYLFNVLLWVIYLILFYYYLSFVMLAFAESRPLAELLLKYVSEPLLNVVKGAISLIPNFIMLVIIAMITRYLIRGVRLFFDNIEEGVFEFENFEKHWVSPTYFLVRILIIVIALVFAYPYIPGSDSRAFQGLTILAGVMVSLGSNTVVSNMMAGLFVIYRRSTNVGDRIRVGTMTGDVVEIKLMETLIKSIKNEMISIPNTQLLNSEVVNYTRKIDGRGLLVHSTVGIGYEEPPAKVEAMLIEAANRTYGLKKSPTPFVLWSKLADYAINYEINAFTTRGASLPKIYSDLHRHIVDVFNENNTQIMTPSYMADPEIPKIPEAEWDGKLAHEEDDAEDPGKSQASA